MAGFGFPSQCKIKKTDEFSSVFNFRKRVGGPDWVIHYLPTEREHPRLGLLVGKKLARSAVCRNYMKRTVREWFRQQRQLGGVDLLIKPLRPFGRGEQAKQMQELSRLLGIVRSRLGTDKRMENA